MMPPATKAMAANAEQVRHHHKRIVKLSTRRAAVLGRTLTIEQVSRGTCLSNLPQKFI
jgi:hypothetical protein